MIEWHKDLKTKVLKSDLELYKSAFHLLAAKVSRDAGTSDAEVRRYWMNFAAASLEMYEPLLYRHPFVTGDQL